MNRQAQPILDFDTLTIELTIRIDKNQLAEVLRQALLDNKPEELDPLMDADELAELTGLSKNRIYEMAKTRMIPQDCVSKFGRRVRFVRSRMMDWITAGGTAS